MIITEQKSIEEILQSLEGEERIYITGCGSCATAWHTGGEPEIEAMAKRLEEAGKKVVGSGVSEEGCDERRVKKEFRGHGKEISQADAVLVMCCGAGVQTAAYALEDKRIYPALNSLYLARLQRLTKSDERCLLCGDCILAYTGGICPVTICPKGLLNGPCGGSMHGKCEVDSSKECAWIEIYNRMERTGRLEKLMDFMAPKDHQKSVHPRRVEKVA